MMLPQKKTKIPMNKRIPLFAFLGATLSACATPEAHTPQASASAPPPNIVFILVDDLGVMDIGLETPNEDFYETPRIDQLARSGLRFDQGYTASRVCSPARASIMLGTSTARHGITDWIGAQIGARIAEDKLGRIMPPDYVRALPAHETTMAEAFRDAGYKTFFAGKWHLGPEGSWPEDHGFDTNVGGWDVGSPGRGFFAPWRNPNLQAHHDGESLTLRLGRETAAFIQSDKDKPFFAMLSFYAVHAPSQTSQERWAKYRDKAEALGHQGERFVEDYRLPVRIVRDNPIYAGMIETVDDAVGIVMDAIEAAGIADNTIICFTSDHGAVVSGDHDASSMLPLRGGKGMQWEGGLRVPLYVYVPNVTSPGSRTDVPMIGSDIFPTLLDLAGLPLLPEQHLDGVSLAPVMRGESIPERPLFWHYPHYGNQGGDPSSIIRRGDWKLIHYWEDHRRELYNVTEDPDETTDLAAQHAELVDKLGRELEAYLIRVGANLPRPYPGYREAMEETRRQRMLERKARLEIQHAQFLDPDWQPNETWWGSSLGED